MATTFSKQKLKKFFKREMQAHLNVALQEAELQNYQYAAREQASAETYEALLSMLKSGEFDDL